MQFTQNNTFKNNTLIKNSTLKNNIFNGFGFFPNVKYRKEAETSIIFSFGIYNFIYSNLEEKRVIFVNTTLYFYHNDLGIDKNLFENFIKKLKKYNFKFLNYFYKLCNKNLKKGNFLLNEKSFNKYKRFLLKKLYLVKTLSKKENIFEIFKQRIKNKKIIFIISENDRILPIKSQENFLRFLKQNNIRFNYFKIKDEHFPSFLKRYYEFEFS